MPPRRHGDCFEQREQCDFFPLPFEKLRHLNGDDSAVAPSTEVIRAMRLEFAQQVYIIARHFLDRVVTQAGILKSERLESVTRLIRPKAINKVAVPEDIAWGGMQKKKGRTLSGGLQRHKAGPGMIRGARAKFAGESLDGRGLIERAERQLAPGGFFYFNQQFERLKRIAAQFEEAGVDTDRSGFQDAFE